jgi:hypothetical protein
MKYDHRHQHLFTAFCSGAALLFAIPAIWAREAGKLANVTILATGGTIAGTGATSTTTVGYTAATSAAIRVSSQTTSVGRSFQSGRRSGRSCDGPGLSMASRRLSDAERPTK